MKENNLSDIFQIESIYNYINCNTMPATHLPKYSYNTICVLLNISNYCYFYDIYANIHTNEYMFLF